MTEDKLTWLEATAETIAVVYRRRYGQAYPEARTLAEAVPELVAAARELELLKLENNMMRETARWLYDEGYLDAGHEDDCPHDDTCECEVAAEVSVLLNDPSVERSARSRIRKMER